MALNPGNPGDEDVYWTLTDLMTDFGIEVTPREVRRFGPLGTLLPAGTRVGLAVRPGFPATRTKAAAGTLIRSGMRVVLPLDLLDPADRHQADPTLATWESMGVRDIVLTVGAAGDLAAALDDIVAILDGRAFRRRGFLSVGIRLGGPGDRGAGMRVTESAELLRALDSAHDIALDLGIELYLTPNPAAAHRLVRWERSLRAAGNRLPIRAGLPGLRGADLLPWRRAQLSGEQLVLGLAAELACDPDSTVQSVQLFPARTLAQSTRWALDLGKGNFVIENHPGHGHRVTTLG